MNASAKSLAIQFDNSYAQLPDEFYVKQAPALVSRPELIALNDELATQLGIAPSVLRTEDGINMLAGNLVANGSEPLAMAYAGHQFGNFVPQLGDGRALLLGEVLDIHGRRYDIQLKGAGRTPFSRSGDGKNWVGPVVREYIVSEAMAAMGVPTTRALAAVTSGDQVLREYGPVPGAIFTRVARSHIRVGTFEYFAARQDTDAIKQLMTYTNARLYPEKAESDNPALALLESVIDAQAALVAHWQSLGFIHGVMNTDNCSISGETIDYGPCAFMDTYSANKVFSSIDMGSRYAYQNQPRIAQWNLVNLAQCLLPLMHEDPEAGVEFAQDAINAFDEKFLAQYLIRMRAKLGLLDEKDDDLPLISALLELMSSNELDFTLTFRQLAHRSGDDHFAPGGCLNDWYLRWSQRLEEIKTENTDKMRASNPAIIPRNHQIEACIEAAIDEQDFTPFSQLLEAVTSPYDETHDGSNYALPPEPQEIVSQTFCGT